VNITESIEKLPKELVIPNDQIQLLESIGQGELCFVYFNSNINAITTKRKLLYNQSGS